MGPTGEAEPADIDIFLKLKGVSLGNPLYNCQPFSVARHTEPANRANAGMPEDTVVGGTALANLTAISWFPRIPFPRISSLQTCTAISRFCCMAYELTRSC